MPELPLNLYAVFYELNFQFTIVNNSMPLEMFKI